MEKVQVRVGNAVTVTSTAKMFDPVNTGGTVRLLKVVLSADTDGQYQLQDGSGGTTVVAAYIAAKNNITIDLAAPGHRSEFGAQGVALTAGNALYAVGPSGGKLTITAITAETGF